MTVLSVVTVLASLALVSAGIYPEGHWDHATKITTENADSFVKENVDAGKTAPSWNENIAKFSKNPDVVFGDVSLSSDQVREIGGESQNPGAGGWPTVRHFNKETGYGGKAYEQKTSTAMCDELGPKTEYMQQAIEEAAGVSLCSVKDTSTGCSDQQKTFVEKWSGKPSTDLEKQLTRLNSMLEKGTGGMKPEALKWAKERKGILKQLTKFASKEGEL